LGHMGNFVAQHIRSFLCFDNWQIVQTGQSEF